MRTTFAAPAGTAGTTAAMGAIVADRSCESDEEELPSERLLNAFLDIFHELSSLATDWKGTEKKLE